MEDTDIHALQLIDQSVMCKLYLVVSNGEQLKDDTLSNIILYMRQQFRSWKDSQDVASREKDNILLCLSTLLSAARKKLCSSAALLNISLLVSMDFVQ